MIVIDTSVAFKWLKTENEAYRAEALLLLHNHLTDKDPIVVPELLFIEVANALATKSKTAVSTIKFDINKLYAAKLRKYAYTKETLISSALLSRKHQTSVYDMLYAVIARSIDAMLVTADEKFIEKTKFKHVKHISQVTE